MFSMDLSTAERDGHLVADAAGCPLLPGGRAGRRESRSPPAKKRPTVTDIEAQVRSSTGISELPEPEEEITVRQREAIGFITIARTLLGRYPRRSALSFSLFIGQAFLYNAIFFTYSIG